MPSPVEILFGTPDLDQVKASILGLIPIFDRVARAGKTTIEASARDQVRAEKSAVAETTKEIQRAAKEKERLARDSARAELNFIRAGQSAIASAERERTREAASQARERQSIAEKEARAIEASHKRMSQGFGRTMGGSFGRVMGTAGHIAGIAASLGGGFAIADSLRAGIEQEKTAGVIFRGAAQRGDFTNQGEVQKLARQTAIATGGTTDDILGGLNVFVRKTGDLGVAKTMLEDMAKLSAATGANFADMGNTAAEVQNQLGDAAKTMEVMRALAGQGRAGAIDIKDLGQFGGRLAASAAQFTGSLSGNIESFGAIAQLAKKLGGATDTAEATESVARLASDMAKHQDEFRARKIEVFADKGRTKFRNAEDIITESVVKTGGDIGALHAMFGERSIRAVLGAQVAFAGAGGGAAGEAAIRSQFSGLKTSLSQADVDEGVKSRMAETDAKLAIATEQFHAALNDRLMPLLPGMIDGFTRLIPQIERMVEFLVGHPFEGLGLVIGAAITAELAKAGIQGAVTGIFSSLAESVLKRVSGAAVANIAAGTVNVVGGGGGSVPSLLDKGGGAAVGLGGTLAGAGVIAAAGLIPAGFAYFGERREKQGADMLSSIMAMPADTEEQKRDKLAALEGAQHRGMAGQRYHELAMRGEQDDPRKFAGGNAERLEGMDRQAQGMAKALSQITAELETLRATLGQTTPALQAMTDAARPSGGAEAPNVPTGAHPNLAP